MPVQALVGEGVGGELVAQEALDDRFGVGDGVQGHGMPGLPSAIASTAQARTSWAMLCPVKTNKVPAPTAAKPDTSIWLVSVRLEGRGVSVRMSDVIPAVRDMLSAAWMWNSSNELGQHAQPALEWSRH